MSFSGGTLPADALAGAAKQTALVCEPQHRTDVRIRIAGVPLIHRPAAVKNLASTEPKPTAAHHANEAKPQVRARIDEAADHRPLQFWGIGSRDLGNVPKSPLEHPR